MRLTKFNQSSIYLTALLLFGLMYLQALFYFFDIPWERRFTLFLYGLASAWLAILLINQNRTWWLPSRLDWLVFIFWCVVAISVIDKLVPNENTLKYLTYAPFMAILPYLCGRTIHLSLIERLLKTILVLGLLVALMLAMDRYYSTVNHIPLTRWPVFGYDHGRLLVGPLLASALVSVCFFYLKMKIDTRSKIWFRKSVLYLCTVIIIVALISTLARGWLIAGLFGSVIVVLLSKNTSISGRVYLVTVIMVTLWLSHIGFLKYDQHYSNFANAIYSQADFKYESDRHSLGLTEGESILAGDSCRALRGGDSISVRGLLYREALAMFTAEPLVGVGAAKFGHYSCWAAENSYPHSTILHVFAELGILGGGLFIAALALASVTLLCAGANAQRSEVADVSIGVFGLFCTFIVADQFYGNYFMATGTWVIVGIAANASIDL